MTLYDIQVLVCIIQYDKSLSVYRMAFTVYENSELDIDIAVHFYIHSHVYNQMNLDILLVSAKFHSQQNWEICSKKSF